MDARFRRIRTAVVEAAGRPPELDLAAADEWRILVTFAGAPSAYVVLASPGSAGLELVEAAVVRHADHLYRREELMRRFRARIGAGRVAAAVRVSLVVPTHRRPETLAGLLETVARLDPAPFEVIVVDNDPGDDDCRALAERSGARYVREDRRGLNIARRAGLRAATGDVVAFTDDDCLLPPGWLGALPIAFGNPLVAAVTAPGFAAELATGAQLRREEEAGFQKELVRRVHDWRRTAPARAGAVGSGNAMAFRHYVADQLELFPPELDAGTRAPAAGDLYALYRVLAAGYDVAYEPSMYFLHRHPAEPGSSRRTIRAYGAGVGAYYTKLLWEDGDLSVLSVWRWFWRRWLEAVLDVQTGEGERGRVRARWEYFLWSFMGPVAWLRSLSDLDAAGRADLERSRRAPKVPTPPVARLPVPEGRTLSVAALVATGGGDRPALDRCLGALRPQLQHGDQLIVKDGDVHAAWNAAAAEAHADVLLFLSDELEPQPGLLAGHADRQQRSPGLVLGAVPARPATGTLAELVAWREHEDCRHLAREAGAPTAAAVTALNMSVLRTTFERLGGWRPEFCGRVEREWGARALRAGEALVHAPNAVAALPVRTTPDSLVDAAEAEGRGDALLGAPLLGPRSAIPFMLPAVRRAAMALLALLERAGLRESWWSLAEAVRAGAYRQGSREAGGAPGPVAKADIDLAGVDPVLPPGPLVQSVALTVAGRRLADATLPGGQWHGRLLEEALSRLPAPTAIRAAYLATGADDAVVAGDAHGCAVVFGPCRAPGDDRRRAELEALGAEVVVAEGEAEPTAHWAALARAAARSAAGIVAFPLPGVAPGPEWLLEVKTALQADGVAAARGAGLRPDDPRRPVLYVSRKQRPAPYSLHGPAGQYLAVRRDLLDAIGGIDPGVARFGWHAPLLDVVERALQRGYVVARCDTRDLDPPGLYRPHRSRAEWSRSRARGALLVEAARGRGRIAGVAWFVRCGVLPLLRFNRPSAPGRDSLRHAAGALAAFSAGAARAVLARPPRM